MIYNTPGEIIRVSRTGRQYENSCIGCEYMKHNNDTVDRTEQHQCNLYTAMDNFVRCMNFKTNKTINTQTTLKATSS